jgi:hypothetical protein
MPNLGMSAGRSRICSRGAEGVDGKGETPAWSLTMEHIMNMMCHNVTKAVKKKVTLWH